MTLTTVRVAFSPQSRVHGEELGSENLRGILKISNLLLTGDALAKRYRCCLQDSDLGIRRDYLIWEIARQLFRTLSQSDFILMESGLVDIYLSCGSTWKLGGGCRMEWLWTGRTVGRPSDMWSEPAFSLQGLFLCLKTSEILVRKHQIGCNW